MDEPGKDGEHEGPVPQQWRATLAAIVTSLARRDEMLAAGLDSVDPVPPGTAERGRSDLVLDVDVFENENGCRFRVHLVYVP